MQPAGHALTQLDWRARSRSCWLLGGAGAGHHPRKGLMLRDHACMHAMRRVNRRGESECAAAAAHPA